MENESPLSQEPQDLPDDSDLLDEILDDIDVIVGMIERTRDAVAKGKNEVRLIPRKKVRSIAEALDKMGDVLTQRTLQVRSQRAIRDGILSEKLAGLLEEATTEDEQSADNEFSA